jgi:hypothetical protein
MFNKKVTPDKVRPFLLTMMLLSSPSSFANEYVISTTVSYSKSSAPIPEISEEERIATETANILSKAEIKGSYTGGEKIAGFNYGSIWIGNNYIAGLFTVPAKSDWTVVIETNSGQYIAATNFRDNPWTDSPSSGPAVTYLNGVDVKTMTNAPSVFKAVSGPSLTLKQTWSATSKGYGILGKYYIFKNREFPIDRRWK